MVDEYLRTSFDGPDCEYLDGEIVERNWGDLPHGSTQGRLTYLLIPAVTGWPTWQFGARVRFRAASVSERWR